MRVNTAKGNTEREGQHREEATQVECMLCRAYRGVGLFQLHPPEKLVCQLHPRAHGNHHPHAQSDQQRQLGQPTVTKVDQPILVCVIVLWCVSSGNMHISCITDALATHVDYTRHS